LVVVLACLAATQIPRSSPLMQYFVFVHSPRYLSPPPSVLLSFFMHSGMKHFFSNGVVLLVTGYVVETQIGTIPFLFLLFSSHVAGIVVQFISSSHEGLALVGASGGLLGVLAFSLPYCVRTGRGGALAGLVVVGILQELLFVFAFWGDSVRDRVGHWAHLGGAAGGLLFFVAFRKRFSSRSI
jgi:membrane associated rhomboid family serine protease